VQRIATPQNLIDPSARGTSLTAPRLHPCDRSIDGSITRAPSADAHMRPPECHWYKKPPQPTLSDGIFSSCSSNLARTFRIHLLREVITIARPHESGRFAGVTPAVTVFPSSSLLPVMPSRIQHTRHRT